MIDALAQELRAQAAFVKDREPVYERMPGWKQPTRGVTEFSKLPLEAQRYVAGLRNAA